MKSTILIIDDESSFVSKMRLAFKSFSFTEALTIQKAEQLYSKENYDLILLDLKLTPSQNKLDGLKMIEPIKAIQSDTPLVVVTSDEKTETVVKAMKLGADDFLRKSNFDLLSWKNKFELLIENKNLNIQLSNIETEKYPFIGNSSQIKEIKKTLEILAKESDFTVLITGETGVGKEVAARYLHKKGKRSKKPFVAVHLSAIQETLLESALFGHKKGSFTGADYDREGFFRKADGGILFLDEIGDVTPTLQIKLLRFLETKTIQVVGGDVEIHLDVQIVAATNHNLKELIDTNKFRSDLYYRLKNFEIEIPPLRQRKEDISEILLYYLKKSGYSNLEDILDEEVKNRILNYEFPGNIRELKNIIDSMLLKAKVKQKKKVDSECLPEEIRLSYNQFPESKVENRISEEKNIQIKMAEIELISIENALIKTYGNKSAAAKLLGMTADQMRYRVLKWWKIDNSLFSSYSNIIKKYKLEG